MSLKIECEFKAASKPTTYGNEGKTYTKFWCDTETKSEYPSMVEFQFFGEKLDVTKLKPGQPITVHFNISGRKNEWEKDGVKKSGFFQNLMAWKIEADTTTQRIAPAQADSTDVQDAIPF